MAGVLVISKAVNLQPQYKKRFEELGFEDVAVTNMRLDALNTVINDKKPRLVIISSGFYQAGTPYMTGELLKLFPKMNVAAVSVYDYPMSLAPWFIWHGARSYLNLWEGYDEFHRGLQMVREGKEYISPKVQMLIDQCEEWPDTKSKVSKRQMECLLMLCCGLTSEGIGKELGVMKKTIDRHLERLYGTFHVGSREEMVSLAWEIELVTKDDMRFFYEKRKEAKQITLPEWAAVKNKCDRRIAER